MLRMPSRLTHTSQSEPAAQAAATIPVHVPKRRARWPIASTPATPNAAAVARSASAVAPAKLKTPATTYAKSASRPPSLVNQTKKSAWKPGWWSSRQASRPSAASSPYSPPGFEARS